MLYPLSDLYENFAFFAVKKINREVRKGFRKDREEEITLPNFALVIRLLQSTNFYLGPFSVLSRTEQQALRRDCGL